MRIAQVIDTLGWGGAQKMMVSLSSSLRDRNYDVTVISLGTEDAPFAAQLRDLDIPFICLPGNHLYDPVRFWRLVRILRQGEFNLVQTYLTYANILGGLASYFARVPVVASLRNAGVDSRHYKPLRFALEGWVLRHLAKSVLVNGYSIAEAHRERVENITFHVIPNTVQVPRLLSKEERASVRAEITNGDLGPIVISVGRLSAPKGYPDLIEAFTSIAARFPEATLVIAGTGEMKAQLNEMIQTLGMENRIRLLGARNDIPRLLMASDVYVNSSYFEGLSVALLEAMAAGLPVVATTVGDASRLVIEETGLLIQPGQPDELADALTTLLGNPKRSQLMGAAGRTHVSSQYGREEWISSFIDFYSEVVRLS
jgi:glycosyltransferase involved in cell wall biosynthesis